MKINVYGGAKEIGGNKISVDVSKTKIFLDFGEPFNRGEGIYSGLEFVDIREKLGLRDYFEFKLLPEIKGIYSEDALQFTNFKYSAPEYSAVLISHIHSDHFGDIGFVDENIPVYIGYGTNILNNVFNEIYYTYKIEHSGNIVEIKSGKEYKIKNLKVIPVHVDHSIPGAYGFIIKSDEGNIAYTGDLRFHGFRPELSYDFIKTAQKHKIKVLITEGTRVKYDIDKNYDNKLTETDVEQKFYEIIKKTEGPTFVHFSFRNLDRVRSLYNAAKKAKKILVANPNFFYTIDNARELIKDLPETKKNQFLKCFKKDGDVDDDDRRERGYAKPYLENSIDYKWIRKNSKDVVVFLTASELSQIIDIQPKKGSFIFSLSQHYLEGEENEDYYECLMYWMQHFGLDFYKVHCSGHSDEDGIKNLIKQIEPEIVIPVHTEHPEKFREFTKKVIIPEKEKTIKI
jgi:ribonuclease J